MRVAHKRALRAIDTLKIWAAAATLLMFSEQLRAQGESPSTTLPIASLLARYEREMATPPLYQSETGGLILEMITGRQVRITAERRATLLDGLERMALNPSVLEDTRADAAGLLALAGEEGVSQPQPGTAARLGTIYRRGDSELVRRSILMRLPLLEERAAALQMLRGVLEQPAERFRDEYWEAIRSLLATGEDGRRTMRQIRNQGAARNPVALRLLEQYVTHDSRVPNP